MANKSFDDIIRKLVEEHRMDVGPDAWNAFEQYQTDSIFDDTVKERVENHQLEQFPNDWKELDRKIEEASPVDEFDALIGAKLGGLAVAGNSDWDQFEKLLAEDEVFDQDLSDKVKNHTVPNHDTQWPKLSAHLEEIERTQRRIVITKFIEAAVFLLLIISLMQLYPIQNIKKSKIYRTYAVTKDLNSPVLNRNSNPDDINQDLFENVTANEITEDSPVSDLLAENSLSQPGFGFSTHGITNISVRQDIRNTRETEQFQTLNVPINFFENDNDESIESIKDAMSSRIVMNIDEKANEKSRFAKLANLDLKSLNFKRDPILLADNNKNEDDQESWWISSYGSPNTTFINSPYDPHYGVDGYQSISQGYSAGIELSKETESWEFGGGIAYTSLNYQPKQITETNGSAIYGYGKVTLKEMIFDFIEIPLNFKYKLFKKKGWTLYASTGVSANFLANSVYDIDSEYSAPLASKNPNSQPRPPLGSFSAENESFSSSKLNEKDFDYGLFNGGSFQNNFYATLNTGIGVTKNISEGISFFMQPTYNHNLMVGGIGPNNDVHHRLSVQIGTKIRL